LRVTDRLVEKSADLPRPPLNVDGGKITRPEN